MEFLIQSRTQFYTLQNKRHVHKHCWESGEDGGGGGERRGAVKLTHDAGKLIACSFTEGNFQHIRRLKK